MAKLKLDIAFWDYDRTRALADGSVKIDGVEGTFHSAPVVTEIFRGMIGEGRFDVAELGLTYFLRTFKNGESPFVAIPVFPNRAFRHSAIFVNKASGIAKPEDLNGKTIGELALYSHDAGIMPKGMLMDEFGFRPETCRWVIGGLDWPLKPIDFVSHPHPANVEVTYAAEGKELGAMLAAGEIDALISADVPKCMLEHSPKVGRLFPDFKDVERDYYRRTAIFPIMHTVAIRAEVVARFPWVAMNLFRAFEAAKDRSVARALEITASRFPIPWMQTTAAERQKLFGEDLWPYGIEPNRKTLEAFLAYAHEQGVCHRLLRPEELFAPEILDAVRV